MHRFFVPPHWLTAQPVTLGDPIAHQIGRVLRMRPGDQVELLDNSGWAYPAHIDKITINAIIVTLQGPYQANTETRRNYILGQALVSEKKMAWVLQKGTEIGVNAFLPLVAERCLVRQGRSKEERWQTIVQEAAEQSGRTRMPQILDPLTVRQACQPSSADTTTLMAVITPDALPMHMAVAAISETVRTIRLLIGPEGGFAPEEICAGQEAGIVPVSLGPRILRTETAGLAALGAMLMALGEWE